MIFHPNHQRLNPKTLNRIADELIAVGEIAQDKEKFRNSLIYTRLMEINDTNLVSSQELNNIINTIRSPHISNYQLTKVLRSTLKSLDTHYKELIHILQHI